MGIDENTILSPTEMSIYYKGYIDGMKWLIAFLQEPSKRRRLPTQEEMEAVFGTKISEMEK